MKLVFESSCNGIYCSPCFARYIEGGHPPGYGVPVCSYFNISLSVGKIDEQYPTKDEYSRILRCQKCLNKFGV